MNLIEIPSKYLSNEVGDDDTLLINTNAISSLYEYPYQDFMKTCISLYGGGYYTLNLSLKSTLALLSRARESPIGIDPEMFNYTPT